MSQDDKILDLTKKLRAQNFQPFNLEPLFNDLIKKAGAAHNLFDLNKSIFSAQTFFGSNPNLLPLLAKSTINTSSLQNLFNDATKTADIYRSLSSLTNPFTKLFGDIETSKKLNNILFPTFEFPKSSLQSIIDAGKNFTELHRVFDPTSGFKIELEKLAQLQKGLAITGLPHGMVDFASRVLKETEFRQAFLDRLESESFPTVKLSESDISVQETLQIIERGIEESGLIQPSNDTQASLSAFFAWFNKLNPDVRALIIGLLTGLLVMVIDHRIYDKNERISTASIKIVQKVTNNIFIEVGASNEVRRQFRIVTKNGLPVFQSNRRDSERIATLDATQVVVIKNKRRNWTQIEWNDLDTGEMKSGWVFTRYLKKI